MIFVLGKFIDVKDRLEDKVLGTYYSQMEEINMATGMEVYNLEKRAFTQEELEELEKIY